VAEIKHIQIKRNPKLNPTSKTSKWLLEVCESNGPKPAQYTTYYLQATTKQEAQDESEQWLDKDYAGWRDKV